MPQEPYPSIYHEPLNTYIITTGMLVRVGNVMSLAEDDNRLGLIICRNEASFGFNDDWWEVLVNGAIIKLTGTNIWPLDDYEQEVHWDWITN